jgi:hypothetical protein
MGFSDLTADIEAAASGKHDVQQNDVEGSRLEPTHGVRAVLDVLDRNLVRGKIFAKETSQLAVVVNQ